MRDTRLCPQQLIPHHQPRRSDDRDEEGPNIGRGCSERGQGVKSTVKPAAAHGVGHTLGPVGPANQDRPGDVAKGAVAVAVGRRPYGTAGPASVEITGPTTGPTAGSGQ